MPKNLTSPKLMCLKAILFIVVGLTASTIIILESPSLKIVLLLLAAIWAFARAYYFIFYVIQHYIDPGYRYAGLFSFLRYLLTRRRE